MCTVVDASRVVYLIRRLLRKHQEPTEVAKDVVHMLSMKGRWPRIASMVVLLASHSMYVSTREKQDPCNDGQMEEVDVIRRLIHNQHIGLLEHL
jgi:hypothetical protein